MSAALTTNLPDTSGVYLFSDAAGTLLYVGKSKAVRSRVKAHFAARGERRMMRRVRHIEVRPTAGELGALLLESKLIKELRPMFNVMSRQRRRIIVARGAVEEHGYVTVTLSAIDYLKLEPDLPVLGIFKTRAQAKEFLATIAHDYRLCPKLLKLEQPRRYCFSYHLGRCNGACMGEEDPAPYNARLDQAFDARRIRAWPYGGPVLIEERTSGGTAHELFLIDNWCLIGSAARSGATLVPSLPGGHRFDYDSYRILYAFMADPRNAEAVRPADEQTLQALRALFTPPPVSRRRRRL